MGKSKRKNRSSSDSDINKQNIKQTKQRGPSGDISLSDVLSQASAVLYNPEDVNSSVFVNEPVNLVDNMAESRGEPTSRDIMNCLNAINCRLDNVEKKLTCITRLEERFSTFEKDIKCMCQALETRIKGARRTTGTRIRERGHRCCRGNESGGAPGEGARQLPRRYDIFKISINEK